MTDQHPSSVYCLNPLCLGKMEIANWSDLGTDLHCRECGMHASIKEINLPLLYREMRAFQGLKLMRGPHVPAR